MPGHALITGVGGFVGGVVARAFAAAGWRVTGTYRRHRPEDIHATSMLSLITADLRHSDHLPAHYDCLVHCAAEIPASCPDETALFTGNVGMMRTLLEHAASAGARKVLYLSSMAVYGSVAVDVVDESTAPIATGNYGLSKAEGERLLEHWCARTGGAGASIRLPGVVGARGRNNFLCDTLQCILAGRPVVAHNPDALFNNVVHVEDLAAFLVHLAASKLHGHRPLTIAAAEPIEIREVVRLLHAGAGRPEHVSWGRRGRPFLIAFDHARALGFEAPAVSAVIGRFVAETLSMQAGTHQASADATMSPRAPGAAPFS